MIAVNKYQTVSIGEAANLTGASIKQIHTRYRSGNNTLILGSANFTRRNLTDYNLETDVAIRGSAG